MPLDQSKIHNRLLRALPPKCFAALSQQLEPVDLKTGHVLVQPNASTGSVVFIESGLGSVVASSSDGETVEVGHLGFEGLSGIHLLLKARRTPNKTFMQTPGSGLALSSDLLERFLLQHPEASELLLRYVHSCALQLAHSALANARYNMSERLARWLLMCHDRIRVPDLPITHEFLSLMLGVRRSGVTDQLHVIEGLGIVKATRGNLRILNRAGLEEVAGSCYGVPEREYDRLVGAMN